MNVVPIRRTRVRQFRPTDVLLIELQGAQRNQLGVFDQEHNLTYGRQLEEMGPAWTMERANGDILMCAGFGVIWPDRQATAWALIAGMSVAEKRFAVRAARAILDHQPFKRVEALARERFKGEGRFLAATGFTFVAPLRHWGPMSETYQLWERVG